MEVASLTRSAKIDERKIVIYTVHVSLHRTDDSQVSLPAATAAAKRAKAAAKSRPGKGKAKTTDADAAAAGSDDDDEQKQMDVQEEDGPAGLDAVPAGNDQQTTAAVDSDDESASGGVIGEIVPPSRKSRRLEERKKEAVRVPDGKTILTIRESSYHLLLQILLPQPAIISHSLF